MAGLCEGGNEPPGSLKASKIEWYGPRGKSKSSGMLHEKPNGRALVQTQKQNSSHLKIRVLRKIQVAQILFLGLYKYSTPYRELNSGYGMDDDT
ncbi:hypothetical protein ANN_24216 [Periplaneta americana]|uniref:Uncharacterized protein n=1 Tax=Periplaneta americana TaxID=6978 RepID=A0ABQ8S2H3_PERAM|nr:hypothetical protein ANN_24216 [Periplaneta americana]